MEKKRIYAIATVLVVAVVCTYCLINKQDGIVPKNAENNKTGEVIKTEQVETVKESKKHYYKADKEESVKTGVVKNLSTRKEDKFITKTNLHNEMLPSALPLSAISIISELPKNVKESVLKIAETSNIYMIQPKREKLLVITDNPANIRHGVEFIEISTISGQQTKTTLGYNDKMKDSENDKWEYNEAKQPIRHTKYNNDGDMEFVETWSYEPNEPIKYEMKDDKNNVISVRKETLENGTDLRIEHLLYDKHGKTEINVSATYEGEDIKRFTYYNADKINDSGSIFSDYSNGLKTKETVYTSDLKVKNSYTSEYNDGNREEITKWDNKNQEVHKYLPEE